MTGWIKLHRGLMNWEWYDDANTLRVFLHCLLKANHKTIRYHGEIIKIGSFFTGRSGLAEELHMSEQNVRTALNHLQSTNEITIKSTRQGSVITVNNYIEYQNINQPSNQQSTNSQPTVNQQLTTNKKEKNIKKEKKEDNKNKCSLEAEENFEKLWKLYPLKRGKGQVRDKTKRCLLDIGYEQLERCIIRYLEDLKNDSDWRKPQNGSTFFNSGYKDYLDENYEKPESIKAKEKGRLDWIDDI